MRVRLKFQVPMLCAAQAAHYLYAKNAHSVKGFGEHKWRSEAWFCLQAPTPWRLEALRRLYCRLFLSWRVLLRAHLRSRATQVTKQRPVCEDGFLIEVERAIKGLVCSKVLRRFPRNELESSLCVLSGDCAATAGLNVIFIQTWEAVQS